MTEKEKNKATGAKLVSSALIGMDCKVVLINGKRYVIDPPTIKKIAGAAYHLASIAESETLQDFLDGQTDISAVAHALSWFINGDDSLAEELSHGALSDVVSALADAYSLINVQDFTMLSTLARNVAKMIANQKQ